jgi:RNA polymerase sigma-70 factor, ECF subfamily
VPANRAASDAFAELASAHLDAAYNLARWLVRDPVLADDVVQDAMLRALKYFASFRGENARAWLLQIVRNAALTRLRADAKAAQGIARHDDALEADADSAVALHGSPELIVMREQDERTVTALLESLPVELRECLVLRELEELSYKEIARVIDAPIGTVMSRLWRARQQLARRVDKAMEAAR